MATRQKVIDRFQDKIMPITESGCWLWLGTPDRDGYARMQINEKKVRVHRFAYMYYKGQIPEGMLVCHTCDIPLCANPDHLFLGTPKDNTQDALNKNRLIGAQGVKSGTARLTENNVLEIRKLLANGICRKRIAAKFNVSYSCIRHIAQNKRWRHIYNVKK